MRKEDEGERKFSISTKTNSRIIQIDPLLCDAEAEKKDFRGEIRP